MPGITKMPDIFYNSAMPLKQINQAENQLVVGGIKVLGSLEGPGVTSIKQNINSLSTSVQTVGQKQQDYFSSIADDTIITPGEKKTLKKEWNTIQQTYASIIELAKERDLDDTVNFINLKTRYNELYAYLFTELKVFDNMSENTTIPNTRTFTETYNNYYGQELICQNLLASESGTLVVRQLESLDSPGSPNEIAIHKGQLYRYNDTAAKWEYISTGNYVGILASVPDPIMDNYFLAGVDIVLNHAIKVTGKVLRSSKNKVFQIKKTYKKGLIYIYTENGWTPILDKNDYRYIIATNDLLKIGEDVSPGIESIARQPKYFSTCNSLPEDYKNKDFFVYSGDTKTIQYGDGQETLFIHGELYQFNAPTWTKLESSDPANNQQFMTALTDLLIVHEATEGYFTSVLVKNLIANEAFIKSLATQIITLSQDPNNPGKTGIIQSDNYESSNGETGFRLDYDGTAKFNGNTIISGQCNIGEKATFFGNIITPAFSVAPITVSKIYSNPIDYSKWNTLLHIDTFNDKSKYNNEQILSITFSKEIKARFETELEPRIGKRGYAWYVGHFIITTKDNTYEYIANSPEIRSVRVYDFPQYAEKDAKAELQSSDYETKIVFTLPNDIIFSGTFYSLKLGELPTYDPEVEGMPFLSGIKSDTHLYISRGSVED